MTTEDRTCPFCNTFVARQRKVHQDINADVIECPSCGIFEMPKSQNMLLRHFRDQRLVDAFVAAVRPANAEEYVLRYPNREKIAGHEWVTKERESSGK